MAIRKTKGISVSLCPIGGFLGEEGLDAYGGLTGGESNDSRLRVGVEGLFFGHVRNGPNGLEGLSYGDWGVGKDLMCHCEGGAERGPARTGVGQDPTAGLLCCQSVVQ